MIVSNINKIVNPILIIIIIGLIELFAITFRISDKVNTDKYFNHETESAIDDNICNI